jgi:uncharacterized protein YjlB
MKYLSNKSWYGIWYDENGNYHRYYGPAFTVFDPNIMEVVGRWRLHGDFIK